MKLAIILPTYLFWHYTKAPSRIISLTVDLVRFNLHLFSISIMLKTLFSPWRKISEDYKMKGLDITELLTSFTVNTIMRIMGAIFRSIVIILSLVFATVIILGGFLFFIYWLLLPVAVIFLLIFGPGIMIAL